MLSVIIVNYNTGNILRECVESLFKHESLTEFEVLIVDNCSPDNSNIIIKELAGRFSRIKYFLLSKRVSFSEANNIGFESSNGEFILIMNPDIIFTEPVFEKLKDVLCSNGLGACSPLLIGTDGKFQRIYFQRFPTVLQFVFFYSVFSRIFMNSKFLINRYQYNLDLSTDVSAVQNTDQIPCAFYFTTRDMFAEAGKMDPSFRLFFEDVDLSYRTGRIKPLAIDSSLRVTHLGGSSFKREDDFWMYGRFITGMLTFFRKHYSKTRYSALRIVTRVNSYIVLLSENILGIFGRSSEYRKRKHRYFLDQLNELQ